MSEVIDLINKANSIVAFSDDESATNAAAEIIEGLKILDSKMQGRESLRADLQEAKDHSNYFERQTKELREAAERQQAKLEAAISRAESAEADAKLQHEHRAKETESFGRLYLENKELKAQLSAYETALCGIPDSYAEEVKRRVSNLMEGS